MTKKPRNDSKRPQPDQYPSLIETRNLTELGWHSRQDENFHPLSDDELARLADDMQHNGQRDAIEITPDGRIIDGHQRLRAARRNGWGEVRIRVRHDLAGDEAAIERRMIEANLTRRQLDGLDRVRLARRLEEIKCKAKPGGLSQWAEKDLRERIGQSLGLSGRHVQRFLNILRTPMPVQRAYSMGTLSMKLAERVAHLGKAVQGEIADAITAGGDPAGVVIMHLPVSAKAAIEPDREYELFLGAVTRALATLDGHIDRVRGGDDLDAEIEVLGQVGPLVSRLIRRHKTLKKLRAQTLREFAGMGD